MEHKDVKALKRGLFYMGLAIIAAVLSNNSTGGFVQFLWFTGVVVNAFFAYLYLRWRGD